MRFCVMICSVFVEILAQAAIVGVCLGSQTTATEVSVGFVIAD